MGLRGALEGQSWEFSPSGCSLTWGGCAVAVGCFFFILWSHCAWQLPFRRIGLVFCALGVHAGVRLPPCHPLAPHGVDAPLDASVDPGKVRPLVKGYIHQADFVGE